MLPDLVVSFGPRSVLAALGALLVIGGVWFVDRTWDEKGSRAYERAKERNPTQPVIEPEELDAAFPFPIAFLVGWALLAASFLFPTSGGSEVSLSVSALIAIASCIGLGVVASVPMGNAVRYRMGRRKQQLSGLFMLFWVALVISSAQTTGNGAVSFIFGAIGMVSILVSMKLLWKYRKMGDSWEGEGRPNPNPVVYNMGGPLFVLGWFLFVIAMSSTNNVVLDGETIDGLALYFNWRTALAFGAGLLMVPVVMMIDYAHDEGGKYVGFGTDGAHFGRFLESPVPFVALWTLFGLSSFLAADNTFAEIDLRRILILGTAVVQALVAGVLIQTATYKQNLKLKTKLGMGFMLLFLFLALTIGFDGGSARYLALLGAVTIVVSQKTVFGDRKRGDYWMEHNEVNPSPIVYSVGEPLFMAGWILLAWAISLPMG